MRSLSRGVVAVALVLSVAACGGGGASPSSSSSSATQAATDLWETSDCARDSTSPSPSSDVPEVPEVAGLRVDAGSGTGGPTIAVQKGFPSATSLVSIDMVPSTEGSPVTPGSKVAILYCGVGQSSRAIVDNNFYSRYYPLTPLNELIPGLRDGIVGMRDNGRRLLVIPAAQGYGDKPPADSGVAPGETLIYVVELAAWQP